MRNIILVSLLLAFAYPLLGAPDQNQMLERNSHRDGISLDGQDNIVTGDPVVDDAATVPDLEIESISHVPVNPQPGTTVEILVTVINNGAALSGSYSIDVFVDQPMKPVPGDWGDVTQVVTGGLGAGVQHITSIDIVYYDEGTMHLWALLDSQNEIIEVLNDNNVYGTYEIPVGTATMIGVDENEEIIVPAQGGDITYEVTVEQFGDPVTIDGWVSITYTSFGTGIDFLGLPVETFYSGLPYAFEFTQQVPALAPPGEYQLAAALGVYPWIVESSDKIFFTKLGDEGDSSPVSLGTSDDWHRDVRIIQHGGSGEPQIGIPSQLKMHPAYPNPFNPVTSVTVSLQEASDLTVTVFNVQGGEVAQLADGMYTSGEHEFAFDGRGLASGVYLITARTSTGQSAMQKVILTK